jgi:hypothetical protein
MTDWKYNVYLADLKTEFDKDDDEDKDVKKCVDIVHDRLVLLKRVIEKDDDPDDIIHGLDDCINDFHYFDSYGSKTDQIERFDELMDDLYDFADWNFIWLNTFDREAKGIGEP